ncbi:hypothetical protein SAMN04515669_2192 [Jiangella sp. DSM 45060]|nr:hypothetical protein SAMN04515669_2192 [Jiangella sp. DSM 45060]
MRIDVLMTVTHDHHWTTKSRHRTSEGIVVYDGCTCGRFRVRHETTLQVEKTLAVTHVTAPVRSTT